MKKREPEKTSSKCKQKTDLRKEKKNWRYFGTLGQLLLVYND